MGVERAEELGAAKGEEGGKPRKGKERATLSHVLKSDGFNDGLLHSRTAYECLMTGATSHVHPESGAFQIGVPPEFVVYHEVVMTTRPYMHCLTAVEPEWLAEAAPKFFTLGRATGVEAKRQRVS